MPKESQLIPLLSNKSLILTLPPLIKIKIKKRCKELKLSPSQYITFLIENYEEDSFNSLTQFRYNLIKRVKKGINLLYINELIKLKNYLDIILAKL